jgi:hypothetical protein
VPSLNVPLFELELLPVADPEVVVVVVVEEPVLVVAAAELVPLVVEDPVGAVVAINDDGFFNNGTW